LQQPSENRKRRIRPAVIFMLKCILAAGAMFWLVRSGKIDFSLLKQSLSHGREWAICAALLFAEMFISALRLKYVLQIKARQELPYPKVFHVNWISNFLGTALPGGDATASAAKLIYVRSLDRSLGVPFIIAAILTDRICGFCGLVGLSGLASLLFYRQLTSISETIAPVLRFNIVLFLCVFAPLLLVLVSAAARRLLFKGAHVLPYVGTRGGEKLHLLLEYLRKGRKVVPLVVLLSMCSQTAQITAYWVLLSPFMEGELPMHLAFSIMPIGLLVTSIPITPWGIGIGHLTYAFLFSRLNVANGASLANLIIISLALVSLTGVIPYFLVRVKAKPVPESGS